MLTVTVLDCVIDCEALGLVELVKLMEGDRVADVL